MYLVCGEALFDVFVDGEKKDSSSLRLDARPGGSPFNVAIGIARLGQRAALLTGIAHGTLGEHLVRTLKREKVSTDYLIRAGKHTTLSIVDVDELGQPKYSFYGLGSADGNVTTETVPALGPEIVGLHFGSYSIVIDPVAEAFAKLASNSEQRFISVDPNVRLTVEPDRDIWRTRVLQYASRADLVKVSMEDLRLIYPDKSKADAADMFLNAGASLVVITDGGRTVCAWTHTDQVVRVAPPATSVVDTVGAGDSFQSALLTRLTEIGAGNPKLAINRLDRELLENLLQFAVQSARVTCRRRGANLPFRNEVSTEVD